MTNRHLTAFGIALAAFATCTAVVLACGRAVERRYVHSLGYVEFDQKILGTALQAEAFRQPDLLPVYGSSEMVYDSPFHASRLFAQYPTGFRIFPVATLGATPLMIAQRLAPIGTAMRGRKVVISIVPTSIYRDRNQKVYVGNFSRLQAASLVFNLSLPHAFKRDVARLMVGYPLSIADDIVLRTAIQALAHDSLKSRALYALLIPLGKMEEWTLRMLDHAEVLLHAKADAGRPELDESHVRHDLDWPWLERTADRLAAKKSDSNPFGIDNVIWERHARHVAGDPARRVMPLVRHIAARLKKQDDVNWKELELLLQELETFGAQPLLLSAPFSGRYFDQWGVGVHRREKFYATLRDIASRHHVPLVDFEDHDEDPHFVIDTASHPSAKAWIYYDRAMDCFFRDLPLPVSESVHQ